MKNIYDIALNAAQETREVVLNEMRTNGIWVVNDALQSNHWRTPGECRSTIYTLALANVITSNDMNALLSLVESVAFDDWKEHKFPTVNPYLEEGRANMARLLEEWTNKYKKNVPETETV